MVAPRCRGLSCGLWKVKRNVQNEKCHLSARKPGEGFLNLRLTVAIRWMSHPMTSGARRRCKGELPVNVGPLLYVLIIVLVVLLIVYLFQRIR